MVLIPEIFANILKVLSKSPGQSLYAFRKCLEDKYESTDSDIAELAVPYLRQLSEWGLLDAFKASERLTLSAIEDEYWRGDITFYLSEKFIDMQEMLGLQLGSNLQSI